MKKLIKSSLVLAFYTGAQAVSAQNNVTTAQSAVQAGQFPYFTTSGSPVVGGSQIWQTSIYTTGFGTSTPARAWEFSTPSVSNGLRISQTATGYCPLDLNNATTGGHLYQLLSTGASSGKTTYAEGAGNFGIYDYTAAGNVEAGGAASNAFYRFFISSSGNIGIGNVLPSAKLTVTTSGSNSGLNISNTTNNSVFSIAADGSTLIYSNTSTNTPPLTVQNGGVNLFQVASTGATTINGALSATGIINSANAFTTGPAGNSNYAQVKCDGTNTTIDQFGTAAGGILLSYLTGKDVNICTNIGNGNGTGMGSNGNGGFVNTGFNVNIGGAWPQSSAVALNIRSHGTTALNIQTPTNAPIFNIGSDGSTLISSSSSTNSPLKITNSTMTSGSTYAQTPFEVTAGGQVFIGTQRPNSSNPEVGALLSVSGNVVVGNAAGNAGIYINQINWADFVFEKDYKLMPLIEVENFYKENHHLPNVPTTKEIKEKGNNLGQTDAILLQKIEENTLYIVQLKKQLEAQQKLIEELVKKLANKK